MKHWICITAGLLLSACAQVSPVASQPPGADLPWQQRTPAIAYLRYEPVKSSVVHALRIDLQFPGVRVELTPQGEAGQTLPNMPGTAGALASVNASFFTKTFTTRGFTVSHGQPWSGISEQQNSPFIACDRRPRCVIQLHVPLQLQPGWTEVVSGTPWLLEEGRLRTAADDASCAYLCAKAHPRTAVGLDASGRWLYLVAAEGRRGPVLGLTLTELSLVMQQLGARNAVNLDGGGSTTMLLQGESMAARPFNEPELRKVANALVIRD